MKPKLQKQITLDEIINTLSNHPLTDARLILEPNIGATMEIAGKVLKVIKRDGLKLHVEAENTTRRIEIFGEFSNESEQEKVKEAKIKKGATVTIIGIFQTFGTHAVTMTDCQLKQGKLNNE